MIKTLKAFSVLLSYPSEDLQSATAEIAAICASEKLLSAPQMAALNVLLTRLGEADLIDLQEQFVLLFDRSRSLSLNIFEHVHGESRDRGGAMVDMLETYRSAGLEPISRELPDHLPVLLEYLALQPFVDAQAILADAAHILSVLSSRLSRRGSDYAAVFDALLHLADCQPDGDALAALQAQSEDDPEDLAALDAVWAESQVTFGPDIGPNKLHTDCPQAEEMLARMKVPQNHLQPAK